MIDENQARIIAKKVLDEEHLLGFIKIFEKEHNLFRGSHDKMGVPPSIIEDTKKQIDVTIGGLFNIETLDGGDFMVGIIEKANFWDMLKYGAEIDCGEFKVSQRAEIDLGAF